MKHLDVFIRQFINNSILTLFLNYLFRELNSIFSTNILNSISLLGSRALEYDNT